jgi:N,N'-diacetyllegionaminate synthase
LKIKPFNISGRPVGPGTPCFIIAEAGVNHNGDMEIARKLIDTARAAGADAVKFQTFRADRLATRRAPKAEYQQALTDSTESQFDMLRRLELPEAEHQGLADYCIRQGILFLSTPFDEKSADFLHRLGLETFKIPSGEITNRPFLEHVARIGRPLVLSTGMSSLDEVKQAVATIRAAGNPDMALLHCVSNYPADPQDANLHAMNTLREAFEVPVGFSDHTPGVAVSLAAVALGACIIEKHFTLDKQMPGPDHKASLEPEELGRLVREIRMVESALGDGCKQAVPAEADTADVARKSLVAAVDIPTGTVLTRDHLHARRPGTGLSPYRENEVIGRSTNRFIAAGTLIELEMMA